MIFTPPRTLGLAVGFGGLALLLGFDALIVAFLPVIPPSPLIFLGVCLILLTFPLIGWIGYRCYGLIRSRYVLSQNALVVEWGGRREVIPTASLVEVRLGAELGEDLRPPLSWPGCVVGQRQLAAWGRVEFLAATDRAGQVAVKYDQGWLVLSPSDAQAFVSVFEQFHAQGPETAIEPESIQPDFWRWSLWQDRWALLLIGVGGLSALVLLGYLSVIVAALPPEMVLHFNAQGEPDRIGAPTGLFILPAIAGLAWLINTGAGAWLYRRAPEQNGAYLLFSATMFVQALVWTATVGILTAG